MSQKLTQESQNVRIMFHGIVSEKDEELCALRARNEVCLLSCTNTHEIDWMGVHDGKCSDVLRSIDVLKLEAVGLLRLRLRVNTRNLGYLKLIDLPSQGPKVYPIKVNHIAPV